jgi:excinuclease ABC subunit C
MVVWEDGRMKKSDYRKFIIRSVVGNDDFASMREVVTRRYSRLKEEGSVMPGLVQLHAAIEALEAIGVTGQPLASIAEREEIVYVPGAGGRAGHARPLLAHPAFGADHSRRGAPLRRDFPPLAARRQLTSELHAFPGVGEKGRTQAAEGVWQRGRCGRRRKTSCGRRGGRQRGRCGRFTGGGEGRRSGGRLWVRSRR